MVVLFRDIVSSMITAIEFPSLSSFIDCYDLLCCVVSCCGGLQRHSRNNIMSEPSQCHFDEWCKTAVACECTLRYDPSPLPLHGSYLISLFSAYLSE